MTLSGVYQIAWGNKRYIGGSKDIVRRWREHHWLLRHRKHPNRHLREAWDVDEPLVFRILFLCEPAQVRECEWRCIVRFHPELNDHYEHTPETIDKMRRAKRGKRLTDEHRAKLKIARNSGNWRYSENARRAVVARNQSEKQIAAVRAARAKQAPPTLGMKFSAKACANMKAAALLRWQRHRMAQAVAGC